MNITGNEPAMPFVPNLEDTLAPPEAKYGFGGLSIRQQFAMAAMQSNRIAHPDHCSLTIALSSIEDADALIAQLNKSKS